MGRQPHLQTIVDDSVTPSPTSSSLKLVSSDPHKQQTAVVFFFVGAVAVVLVLLIILFMYRKLRRTNLNPKKMYASFERGGNEQGSVVIGGNIFSGNLRTISYFQFHTLKKATNNFNQSNLLGRGGFGPVYKGKLSDGRMIAVKQLSFEKSQQGESEFLSEVRLITSIQHKNLVRLLGCCMDGSQRLLVYEYMKNRSLHLFIYGKSEQFLNWNTRFQIIIGVARGLQYLHEDSPVRIVHRDIKASNILLDDKFQPKIGDFGLARFFPEDQAYLSTNFAGTLGYTAPEYAIRGELTEKADIYSFGVLVLEIIHGQKNTDLTRPSEMQYLPEYAWRMRERRNLLELIDPKIRDNGFDETDAMRVINVAFMCLQPFSSARPPMSEIVARLTCREDVINTPIKPAFLERKVMKIEGDDEKFSWDTLSEVLPSPLKSMDSLSLSQSSRMGS